MSDGAVLLVRFASVLGLLGMLGFFVFSVWLSAVDIRTHRLPNRLVAWSLGTTLGLLTLSCLLLLPTGSGEAGRRDLLGLSLGALVLFAVFLVLWLLVPGGIGAGDAKIAPLAGGVLGFFGGGWAIAIGTVAAFALAAVWGVMLRGRGGGPKREVPFAPCLFAGAWIGVIVTTFTM